MTWRTRTESKWRNDNPRSERTGRRAWRLAALACALAVAVLACGAATAAAKEKKPPSKTVSGTVFDEAGNPIEGATVELSDLQTGKVLAMYSQPGGTYQFGDLSLDHDYKLKATYKGKSSEERHVSSIDDRTRPVINLTVPKAP
jgi:hypothetical protein